MSAPELSAAEAARVAAFEAAPAAPESYVSPNDEFSKMRADIQRELGIRHIDDIPWHKAPVPPRFHKCTPQTSSPAALRCACGAIASTFGPWMERNSRLGPWWKFGKRSQA